MFTNDYFAEKNKELIFKEDKGIKTAVPEVVKISTEKPLRQFKRM